MARIFSVCASSETPRSACLSVETRVAYDFHCTVTLLPEWKQSCDQWRRHSSADYEHKERACSLASCRCYSRWLACSWQLSRSASTAYMSVRDFSRQLKTQLLGSRTTRSTTHPTFCRVLAASCQIPCRKIWAAGLLILVASILDSTLDASTASAKALKAVNV
jgi:hypothetical protein